MENLVLGKTKKNIILQCMVFIAISSIITYFSMINRTYLIMFVAMTIIFILFNCHWSVLITLNILILESFFGLINVQSINIPGGLNIYDFSFVIMLLLFLKVYKRKKVEKYYFKNYIIFIIVLSLIEVINSYYLFGQPLLLGLRAARWILLLLTYFPIRILVENKKNKELLYNIVIFFGFIASVISIFAYLHGGDFLNIHYNTGERYGDISLSISTLLIILSSILLLDKIFHRGSKNVIYIFIFCINLLNIMIVVKTRVCIIGLLCMLGVILLIQNRYKKIYITVLVMIMAILTIYNSQIIANSILSTSVNEYQNQSGTLGVRFREIAYYTQLAEKSPLLGNGGNLNKLYSKSLEVLNTQKGMYASDIGIIGLFFNYGIVGVLWYVFLLLRIIKLIIINKNGSEGINYSAIGYAVFTIGTSMTLVIILDNNAILYNTILFAIFESNFKLSNE